MRGFKLMNGAVQKLHGLDQVQDAGISPLQLCPQGGDIRQRLRVAGLFGVRGGPWYGCVSIEMVPLLHHAQILSRGIM
jgi:hypothetical protein